MLRRTLILLLLAVCGVFGWAQAQTTTATETAQAAEAAPVAPDSPRRAIEEFFDAAKSAQWEKASSYLDLKGLDKEELPDAPTLARQLHEVLDRKVWIDPTKLSGEAQGRTGDGLPAREDQLGTIGLEGRTVRVLLVRTGGSPAWRFAPETVREVPALYEAYGDAQIGRYLPRFFYEWEVLDIRLWQWLGLLGGFFLAYFASWLVAGLASRVVGRFTARTTTTLDDQILERLASPMRVGFAIIFFWVCLVFLRLGLGAYQSFGMVTKAVVILWAVWVLFRLTDLFTELSAERLRQAGHGSAYALLPIGRRTAKVVLGTLAVLAMLQNFGVNVTALLAGLGVGGLAVALASQKTLEHLFGGIMISVDQPVRVGDFCKFGDRVGTVEDVGLRSVRVRTLDRTVVTVPNAEFAATKLENFARRDKIRLHTVIGVRYETTPDQMRAILVGIRTMLFSHPRILTDVLNVRFINFNAYALDIEISTYVNTTDGGEFLGIREDIYLRIMDIVAECGSGFAFPSQTNYIRLDEGLDDERVKATEARVKEWREKQELWMPDVPLEARQELKGKVRFPPEGSASAREGPPA